MRGPRLVGRAGECEALDGLVADVRGGRGRALVVRGEAGAGKTALLNYLVGRALGCRIARAAGVESERELAFAGLHQLCAPYVNRLECLPGPQGAALETAFGLRGGEAPDRFLAGMAVVAVLSRLARERPLVCVVDDAQWLDEASAQALGFAARRLAGAPVAIVFAVRQPGEPALAGLAELAVGGLADGDARALLALTVPGPLDERVRDRIVAEARGNPQALVEVSRGLTLEQLAGGFGLPGGAGSGHRVEEGFARRVAALPPPARRLLLIAAAEPAADPVVVWRAAGQLGAGAGAAAAAGAGLIEFGKQVRFCHPLARAAAYRAATPQERHRVHHALAEATDPRTDPDRRAWHHAHAAPGLDEDAAAELERSAGQARARGGLAAAAAFAERAAELTPDPGRRAHRALAAAQAKHSAGAVDAASRLLAVARAGPLDDLGRARAEWLRAWVAACPGHGRDAAQRLLQAARRLEPLHPRLAREAYRDAFHAALTAGRLAAGAGLAEIAKAVRAAGPVSQPPCAHDLLLDGLAGQATDGYAAAAPMLKQALRAVRDQDVAAEEELGWLALACRVSHNVWDDESWYALSTRLAGLARTAGVLRLLPVALLSSVPLQLVTGDIAAAAAMAEEAEAVAQATGDPGGPYGRLLLAAWRGHQDETRGLIAAATPRMVARGEGQWLTAAAWATAVVSNAQGRYDEALAAAERGSEHPEELGLATWSLAELIEAAARTGSPERASSALQRLSETTGASGTDWALGIEARSRALFSNGEPAERRYREAIERLGCTRARADLARAHLLYGEWLRRENRRVDAREQLRAAHEMLTALGIEAFARRALRELLATGETVRKRVIEAASALTAQEAEIARLASAGHTNPEISTQLFISPRTVEWHLRKVFTKLGVSSRKELPAALSDAGREAVPA